MVIDDLANCLNAKQREICLSQDNYLIMTDELRAVSFKYDMGEEI